MKSKSSCGGGGGRGGGGDRWKCDWQIGGEFVWQTGGCGEESHNHEDCIMAGEGEEKASAGGGWVGGGRFLWITSYIYEALQQWHANERLDKTTEQESSASPLLRHHFCKPVPFSLLFTVMTEDLYQDFIKPFAPIRWNSILNEHSLIKSVQTTWDSVGVWVWRVHRGRSQSSILVSLFLSFFFFPTTCIVPISAARFNVWAAAAPVDDHGHKTQTEARERINTSDGGRLLFHYSRFMTYHRPMLLLPPG